jgi:succinoglycan biosynthesis protein ExoM
MKPSIAICIATYHRPEQLKQTLESLPQYFPEPYTGEIRVVDNDAGRSAEVVARAFAAKSRIPTYYCVEPEQNIALARNRAIEMGEADLIVFIDDDEIASRDWLDHLVIAVRQTKADVVVGPVVGIIPEEAPAWCSSGQWFNKPVPSDNSPMSWNGTRTSNTLVCGRWFYMHHQRFDPDYGRSGGSDVAMFKQIAKDGARIHAASEAVVYEHVELERANLIWLIKRFYRGGMVFERIRRERSGTWPVLDVLRRLLKITIFAAKGMGMMMLGHTNDFIRAVTTSALMAGGINAWLRPQHSATYVEYQPKQEKAT